MRNRHFPRLCRSCQAPMGRQEDTCWRCGTQWAAEDETRTALRVIPGGASTDHASAVAQAHLDAERWIDEGGSVR
jgi:predicted amidophosphoribosyltransferase